MRLLLLLACPLLSHALQKPHVHHLSSTRCRSSSIRCHLDPRPSSDDANAELVAARAQLEKLMAIDMPAPQEDRRASSSSRESSSGSADSSSSNAFRFAKTLVRAKPGDGATDDIEDGLRAAGDIGRRTSGLVWLGLTFWLNLPFAQGFLVASLVAFSVLCATGEFGFIAQAPEATEGGYYSPREPLVTNVEDFVLWPDWRADGSDTDPSTS